MSSKYSIMQKIISVLTVLLFVLPLVVWPYSSYPFELGKAFVLQVITALIVFIYVVAVLYHWRLYRPRFSWLGMIMFVFYVAIFLSAISGVDFWRSFWSSQQRMVGLFAMLHFGALFLIWRSALTKDLWERLWRWFVVIGWGVLLIAIIQVFAPQFLFNLGGDRISSTLGNPIYVASFCIFIFFSSLIFWYKNNGFLKWFWTVEAVTSVFVLFATQTRGAVVGLWGGLICLVVGLLVVRKYKDVKNRNLIFVLLGLLVAVPLLLFVLRNTALVKNVGIINRFVSAPLEQSTGGTRLLFWRVAFNSWKQYPLLGWGWENYYQAANTNYLPELLKFGFGEQWTDNAHNVLFNNLATIGAAGSIAYLLLFVVVFYCLIKPGMRGEDVYYRLFLGSFFVAHFVQNLFVFENQSSYLFLFWMFAGIDIYWIAQKTRVPQTVSVFESTRIAKFESLKRLRSLSIIKLMIFFGRLIRVGIVFCVFLGIVSLINSFAYLPASADYYANMSVRKAMTDFKSAILLHQKATSVKPNPYAIDISFDFGWFFLEWMERNPTFAKGEYRSLAQDMYQLGTDAISYYLSKHPIDARVEFALARAYLSGYDYWQNPNYLSLARERFQGALVDSPKRQVIIFGLARVDMLLGKFDEAIALVEKSALEASDIAETQWMLALLYDAKKDNEKAFDAAKKANELGYKFNQGEMALAFKLFNDNQQGAILETRVKDLIFGSKNVYKVLADEYVEYLREQKREKEAVEVGMWIGGNI